ncbi:hypothetical protein CFD26_102668 [Aspergillus turcosus]|uniref:Cytochrome P450 n=1 Tax=Aspergillus turcosus TaxID=1245748 RepID=A0A3R7IFZ8_9EURO|nr:hypothetical protein CFD26_102668 [Aspergillus turcosus]
MPGGLPFIGNFFEVYPDHLGNQQRLFEQYGPVFKTTNMGRTINEAHPLYPIKNQEAGVFLGDTDTPEWRAAHKFLPPALGPKAVRHYAPMMQETIEDAFNVFDALDEKEEAWNVYQYMLKLGSQAVGKLVLGIDFKHFSSIDAPPHTLVAESLELNKKVTAWGDLYAKLPFGDPQRLRNARGRIFDTVNESVQNAARGGVGSIQHDYAIRATDNKGEKLPKTSLMQALPARTAKVDLILPGGYKLPQDSIVIGALHHLHSNPEVWSNPARFDPDHWDTEEVKNRHKAADMPFATGPRMCIGFNFALQEVKVFLPKLVYRYKFTRENDGHIEYDPMFQLIRPNNLYVRAKRRVKWPPRSDKSVLWLHCDVNVSTIMFGCLLPLSGFVL